MKLKWGKLGRQYVAAVPVGAEARIRPSATRSKVWEIAINGYLLANVAAADKFGHASIQEAKTVVENLVNSGARWPKLS